MKQEELAVPRFVSLEELRDPIAAIALQRLGEEPAAFLAEHKALVSFSMQHGCCSVAFVKREKPEKSEP